MTAALEQIEERLDQLEATPISTDNTPLENESINYKYLCCWNNSPLLINISRLLCVCKLVQIMKLLALYA